MLSEGHDKDPNTNSATCLPELVKGFDDLNEKLSFVALLRNCL